MSASGSEEWLWVSGLVLWHVTMGMRKRRVWPRYWRVSLIAQVNDQAKKDSEPRDSRRTTMRRIIRQ
jgi:hypothetical protein